MVLSTMKMFHVISDIVLSLLTCLGCREMFRMRDAMANFICQMVRIHIEV